MDIEPKELVEALRHYFEDVPLVLQAADAIEELTGFVQEAERDRDEYRERLDKANDAIEELANKLCDWCGVCPKERRRPWDCECLH